MANIEIQDNRWSGLVISDPEINFNEELGDISGIVYAGETIKAGTVLTRNTKSGVASAYLEVFNPDPFSLPVPVQWEEYILYREPAFVLMEDVVMPTAPASIEIKCLVLGKVKMERLLLHGQVDPSVNPFQTAVVVDLLRRNGILAVQTGQLSHYDNPNNP